MQVSVRGGQATTGGSRPIIHVKVGNGPTVPVLLDSGSVGLHIYTPGVNTRAGGGVTVTHRPNSISYVIGTRQSGVIAEAKLTIGGITTTRAIPFGLIRACRACPASRLVPGPAASTARSPRVGTELWA